MPSVNVVGPVDPEIPQDRHLYFVYMDSWLRYYIRARVKNKPVASASDEWRFGKDHSPTSSRRRGKGEGFSSSLLGGRRSPSRQRLNDDDPGYDSEEKWNNRRRSSKKHISKDDSR